MVVAVAPSTAYQVICTHLILKITVIQQIAIIHVEGGVTVIYVAL